MVLELTVHTLLLPNSLHVELQQPPRSTWSYNCCISSFEKANGQVFPRHLEYLQLSLYFPTHIGHFTCFCPVFKAKFFRVQVLENKAKYEHSHTTFLKLAYFKMLCCFPWLKNRKYVEDVAWIPVLTVVAIWGVNQWMENSLSVSVSMWMCMCVCVCICVCFSLCCSAFEISKIFRKQKPQFQSKLHHLTTMPVFLVAYSMQWLLFNMMVQILHRIAIASYLTSLLSPCINTLWPCKTCVIVQLCSFFIN